MLFILLVINNLKSTDHHQTRSLTKFRDTFHHCIGGSYVIHIKNLKEENGVTYLPAYITFCLQDQFQ